MKFSTAIPLVFFASLIFAASAAAEDIQFRFVLSDAEAFTQSVHHYLYAVDESGKSRDVTVADEVFLSKEELDSMEVRFLAGSDTKVSFVNFVLTKDAAEKIKGFAEKYPKREIAVICGDALFKIIHLPFGKSGKIPMSARQIVTVEDAQRFADEIGVKFISPKKTAGKTTVPPPVPSKALVA